MTLRFHGVEHGHRDRATFRTLSPHRPTQSKSIKHVVSKCGGKALTAAVMCKARALTTMQHGNVTALRCASAGTRAVFCVAASTCCADIDSSAYST